MIIMLYQLGVLWYKQSNIILCHCMGGSHLCHGKRFMFMALQNGHICIITKVYHFKRDTFVSLQRTNFVSLQEGDICVTARR